MREFAQHIADMFSFLGIVRTKRMFSGYGLFLDGLMFALVIDDMLYLKDDMANRSIYTDRGLAPFTYQRQGKLVALSYYQAPEEMMDDPDEALFWARCALAAARRADAGKRKS